MSVRILFVFKLVLLASLTAAAEDSAVESYDYAFPFKEIFGRSDHRVGDYAEVEHLARSRSTKGKGGYKYEAYGKLRVKIRTSDAATLKFEGKMFQYGRHKDESGLLDEAMEGLFKTQFGVTHTFSRSAKGKLSTSLNPDIVWQFDMDRQVVPKGPDGPVAQMAHGDRTIQFLWQSSGGKAIIDAYEDGLWLSSGAARNYTFRENLDPDLKLLLLGGMEAVKVAAKFHDTLH